MREPPILFSAEMVKAILAGRKTQTRRVVRPQAQCEQSAGCPSPSYGRLWVREGFKIEQRGDRLLVTYRADGQQLRLEVSAESWGTRIRDGRWRSPIHMPRWAARLVLEIVGLRCEQLQAISEADAYAEGVYDENIPCLCPVDRYVDMVRYCGNCGGRLVNLVDDYFRPLWNSLNAKRGYGWAANPWVWVIEFRRLDSGSGEHGTEK